MTRQKVYRRAHEFMSIKNLGQLAGTIDVHHHALTLQSAYTAYEEFSIRKTSGGMRHIENPFPGLKDIQRKLNKMLQAVYFIKKTNAAYGFIIDVKKTSDRNIVTNALQHLNCTYLLNMDFKDFFHCVKQYHVYTMMRNKPFHFNEEVAQMISKLCCYKGRLPMGAPTSPVLTNLYCMALDQDIKKYCDPLDIRYTRYADDMSFSSKDDIEIDFPRVITNIAKTYQLVINPKKTKWYAESDLKKVTGIIVTDRLDLPSELLKDTRHEIQKLAHIMEVNQRYHNARSQWIKHHQQKIRGYIQFAKQVKGKSDPLVKELQDNYKKAMNPPRTSDPISWQELPYQFL